MRVCCLLLLLSCAFSPLLGQSEWMPTETAGWYRVTGDQPTSPEAALAHANQLLALNQDFLWEQTDLKADEIGWLHHHYRLLYQGIPIDWATLRLHSQAGVLRHVQVFAPRILGGQIQPVISSQEAIDLAVQEVNASRYYWEEPAMEQMRKDITGNPAASYQPAPELVWADTDFDWSTEAYRLAWKMEIFSLEPLDCRLVYVDALTGRILKTLSQTQHEGVPGTAVSRYRGSLPIVSDSVGAADFRLRDDSRAALGIVTLDLNNGNNLSQAIDFQSSSSQWDLTNANWDQASADVHWGSEMAYDVFWNRFGFDSYNGQGGQIRSYVHFGAKSYANAFWNVDHAGYGDDNGSPHVGLDIVGHEITHGVVRNTANLVYIDEGGSLNEGFADIFGNTVEALTDSSLANWLVGEDAGVTRSMANPNAVVYPLTGVGHPDTYKGNGWYTGGQDNGGAHGNSTVLSHWYYLLAAGGTGTNDLGKAFQVQGIGVEDAASIAWRTLGFYLHPTAQFRDARAASLLSAEDLFGRCSPQWQSVVNAWHAVGLGEPVLDHDLSMVRVEVPDFCSPQIQVPVVAYLENRGCVATATGTLQVVFTLKDPLTVGVEVLTLPNGLAPGEIRQVNFTQTVSLPGPRDYNITATSLSVTDPLPANNESALLTLRPRIPASDFHDFNHPSAPDTVALWSGSQAKAELVLGAGVQNSRGIRMEGGNGLAYRLVESYPMWGGPAVDPFDYNPNFSTEACLCLEPGAATALRFDRKQTYSSALKDRFSDQFPTLNGDSIMSRQGSILRVKVNGEEVARYFPLTRNQDPWTTEEVDLSTFSGDFLRLCFEGKTIYNRAFDPQGVGDRIFLDNLQVIRPATDLKEAASQLNAAIRTETNGSEAIAFSLEQAGELSWAVFDLTGRALREESAVLPAGSHSLPLPEAGLAKGLYLIRLEAGGKWQTLRWVVN